MGIEDIQISEELQTNAPSIRYSGNEGPKSPQEIQMMMMSGGQPLPEDPTKPVNPFAPKPTGPVLPNKKMAMDDTPGFELEELKLLIKEFEEDNGRSPTSIDDLKRYFKIKYGSDRISEMKEMVSDRQTAAYGGIMGLDGRKQYGIGSWFQKKIMDPIKENPLMAAAAAYLGYDTYKNTGDRGDFEDSILGKGLGQITKERTRKRGDKDETYTIGGDVASLIGKNIIPIAGGIGAGLFTKNTESDTPGLPDDNTALQLADLKKTANLLDQKQGMAAGLNFLPAVSARKFTPTEMVDVYSEQAANGGRIGFDNGGDTMVMKMREELKGKGYDWLDTVDDTTVRQIFNSEMGTFTDSSVYRANGGRIGFATGGGLMDLGGMEKDYRAEGGFVPIGAKEKADDVPARLSVNEFVFTADAVRNAGGGDIDEGAKVMENMMKHLEAGGQVSEESQGMGGAREMFETSERLSEVI